MKYVGWQVGINYQTKAKEGLDKAYLENLLTEMKDNGMNFISFMMNSEGFNDPIHDGYAWPVKNPKLECYLDKNCINANPKKEFLKEIIEEAFVSGFYINLFMNGFSWNSEKVKIGYPDIQSRIPCSEGGFAHCSDNRSAWTLACDEIKDLLDYYSSSAVKSYGFEMLGRGCGCPDTRKSFAKDLQRAGIKKSSDIEKQKELFALWDSKRYTEVMEELVKYIRKIRPNIEVWHHGFYKFEGVRIPELYKKVGIDVVFPVIHKVMDEIWLREILESSEDFPLVLHVDTRDTPTQNYPIPLKTPKDILNMGEWIEKNNRKNLIGVVFFNEVATSKENKQAVYDVLRKWRKGGLLQ